MKSEQRRGDPKAPQPLAGFFGPHGAALSYFEDTPLAFEWIRSRAKAMLQTTMKTDQRSVNAAWRHAVEAWLCDQALIEVHLNPRVLPLFSPPPAPSYGS